MLWARLPRSSSGFGWRAGGGSLSPARVPGSHQRPTSVGLRRIAHVEDAIELIVVGMRGREVGRAGRHVHVFAVAEPELMHAARMRTRAVEEADRLRLLRHRNVEQLEAGGLEPDLLGLIRDRHDVVGDLERVRAHVGLRQVGLHHHLRLARIGDVDRGEILRRALVRQPQDAAAVGRDLHRHALAHAAEALQLVLRQQLEIPGDRLVAAARQRARVGDGHVVLLRNSVRGRYPTCHCPA